MIGCEKIRSIKCVFSKELLNVYECLCVGVPMCNMYINFCKKLVLCSLSRLKQVSSFFSRKKNDFLEDDDNDDSNNSNVKELAMWIQCL
jgi:hypothetical protein